MLVEASMAAGARLQHVGCGPGPVLAASRVMRYARTVGHTVALGLGGQRASVGAQQALVFLWALYVHSRCRRARQEHGG